MRSPSNNFRMSLLIDAELSNNKSNPIGNSILQPVSANNGVLGHLGSGYNTIESLVTLQNQVVSILANLVKKKIGSEYVRPTCSQYMPMALPTKIAKRFKV